MQVRPDPNSRLFVLPAGSGYSYFGFDNAFRHTEQLHAALGLPAPDPAKVGTIEAYEQYQAACSAWGQHPTLSRTTYFDPGTPDELRRKLERWRVSRRHIRVFLGDPTTGRDWCEEFHVFGHIGRSGGWLKVPLLIPLHDCAGPALLTAHILRAIDADTGAELYRHPAYRTPTFRVESIDAPTVEERRRKLAFRVVRTDEPADSHQASFAARVSAYGYVAFLTGSVPRPYHLH